MRKWIKSLFLGAALFLGVLAQAQVAPATAESLLRQSGLWEQVSSISAQSEAMLPQIFAQGGSKPGTEEMARLTQAIRAAYAPDPLREVLRDVASRKLDARHVGELRRWYDAPVGQAITRLEEKASAEPRGEHYQARLRQGRALLETMPSERRQLLEEMLRQTKGAESMVRITINITVATFNGAARVSSQASAITPSQLRSFLESQRPQLMQRFVSLFLASFAQMYASLPTEDLQKYVTFLGSEAGQHFNTVCMEALEAALVHASADLGRRLPSTRDQSNT